jgi:Trm5-related predicted tRNA methylase
MQNASVRLNFLPHSCRLWESWDETENQSMNLQVKETLSRTIKTMFHRRVSMQLLPERFAPPDIFATISLSQLRSS